MSDDPEKIIDAQNLALYYYADRTCDDFRSMMLNIAKGKKAGRGKKWILQDISFEGFAGEILGIIGSNGTGKTTLCRILSDLLRPDRGKLSIDGNVSALLSLGAGFDNELTGEENIYLNGMMMGFSHREMRQHFNEIVEFSELGEFIRIPLKKYSSGMRVRLGFSIAAMLAPETLVLDETLSTGDERFRQKSAAKMEELIKKARMIVIVTHDMEFVRSRCTRAIWIDKGYIKSEGAPEKVADAYLESVYGKGYIPQKKVPAPASVVRKNLEVIKKVPAGPMPISDAKTFIKATAMGICFRIGKDKFWALRNVSFEIKEGDIVGIIGHNGAGKSTLCRVLTGIYRPDEGTLTVDGKTSALLSLGSGFNMQLPASDNILLNGMMIGIPKKKLLELRPQILEFADLGKDVDKEVKNYSSGMRSKLGFSIAAAIQPELFIIDEALSAGDASFQKKASDTIHCMMKNAKAVIVVTHSLGFVEKECTRAIWFDHGKIMADGDPGETVKKYRDSL
ncbi:MAG: ATP-binding cassette domain-containing protein [Spirochaetia bacterium]|nr:ATP-binding cassette domain-containing protein [Spirochaetia bacterium]